MREPRYERVLALAGVVIVGILILLQVALQITGAGQQIPSIVLLAVMLGLGIRSRARWRKGEIGSPHFAWFLTFLYGTWVPVLLGFSTTIGAQESIEHIAGALMLLLLLCIGIGIVGTVLVSRASDRRANREYHERTAALEAMPPPPLGSIPPPPVELTES